jgi:DNA-binding transcriptional MerR regulator
MKKERLTIGELSRRTGLPVKTLRFWSDEGILPPATRSSSGYRLYGEEELIRLDLVRSLRDAGMGLESIRRVLRRDMSLSEALQLQLATVEAHVASLQGVAAALRAALRNDPTEKDIRRLCAVTKLTNDERMAMIESFQKRVAEGHSFDDAWRTKMFGAAAPRLPDNPTSAQLDAWIELAELVSDPSFVESLRQSTQQIQDKGIDVNGLRLANEGVAAAASAARARNVSPTSEEGHRVVRDYIAALARAFGKPVDAAFERMFRERFAVHDPRSQRYRELLAILNNQPSPTGTAEDWRFITAAVSSYPAP